jgi:hypothetical protein
LPGAATEQFEGHRWATLEQGYPLACDDWKSREVQFVYQIMRQQVVPENTAQKYQDVSAGLLFECGNLRMRIRQSDNARVVPGR